MTIKKFGYDMLPVLAGVLLALLINNWQQHRSEKALLRKVISNIVEENQQNLDEINSLMSKQIRARDSLVHYSDNEELTVLDIVKKVNGLSTPDISSDGMTYLLTVNQSLVDLEMHLDLSKVQREIENYKLGENEIIKNLYQHLYSNSAEDKMRLSLILFDIMNQERVIQTQLEDFNKKYSR